MWRKSLPTTLTVINGHIHWDISCGEKTYQTLHACNIWINRVVGMSFSSVINTKCTVFPRSSNTAKVLNWTRVNLPIKIEKFKSFWVSISTISWSEPGWLWTMKLIKPQGSNRGFTVNVNVHVYNPDIPVQTVQFTPLVLKHTLLQSHLLGGEFSIFTVCCSYT